MKIDYNFIKKIFLTMEEHEKHDIENFTLMQILEISEEQEDKFIGHILILGDNNFIDSNNLKYPFGFIKTLAKDNYQIINDSYRITAKGYEFLEILKNDTAFNRVKEFALDTALDIGKQIIVKLATGGM